jgi:hypothetical protein
MFSIGSPKGIKKQKQNDLIKKEKGSLKKFGFSNNFEQYSNSEIKNSTDTNINNLNKIDFENS